MKNWLPYLTIGLLIVIFIFEEKNDRLEKEKDYLIQYELQSKLDSIHRQLTRSELERNRYYLIADSLLLNSKTLESKLKKANNKLKNIPGRYDHIKQDSLAIIMEERASKWKKEK